MALSELIKYEGDNTSFIWKYPHEDFNCMTELVVHESQEAIFVANGQMADTFGPGRYKLDAKNIPILTSLINLVTGVSEFHSEVYFINKTVQMAIKWGTDSKVRFVEPTLGLPVELGASGEMNLAVSDGRKLLLKLVGTTGGIAWDKEGAGFTKSLQASFRPMISTVVKSNLSAAIKQKNIDIVEVDEHLGELSKVLHEKINPEFQEYKKELYDAIVDENVKELGEFPEKFLECVCPYSYIDSLFNYLRTPNKYKTETAKVMKLYYSAFNSVFTKLGIQLDSNDIMENRRKLQDGLKDTKLFEKLENWSAEKLYYRIIKKYKTELGKIFDVDVITTNYTPFAEQIIELEEKDIAYVHGKLMWFEDVETKEVKNIIEFKEERIIFPFIFVQSGIKPVVSPIQIKEYAKAINFLENADYIIVLGYGINSDDEHIVNMLRECKLGDKKTIYLNYDKDKNVEIKENLEKLLGKESNLEIRDTNELEDVLKEIID